MELSNSYNLILNSMENGVLRSDFDEQLRRKMQTFQTFTLPYLTLLVYRQLWIWIKMPEPKREEARSLWKDVPQNLETYIVHERRCCLEISAKLGEN